MTTVVLIDGQSFEPSEARVSVFDRGFLYGDSVFETLRTYQGRAFSLAEHLARLERSAARVFIEMPVDTATFAREIERALELSANDESYVRVMVTRGSGAMGLDPGLAARPLRVVIAAPLVVPAKAHYESGIRTVTFRVQRVADSTEAAGAKVGNYLVAVLAMRAARAAGAEEALVVDAEERVLEGATSNIFAVLGQRVITPPETLGILPGITRQHLIALAERLGFTVELRALSLSELGSVDELFISSTIRELLPVVTVDERKIGSGRPGPVYQQLLSAFRDWVAQSAT